jgi:uncharacterized protein YbjT (DUF2867 family)
MKLTIVGATGGIGRLLLEQAVAAGHEVTAVVRNPANLTRPVRAVKVDLSRPDLAALESAVLGADAVVSGLGPRSRADAGVTAQGTRAIIAAMKETGTRRLIVVSAAPLGTVPSPAIPNPPRSDPGDGFFMRTIFSRMAKSMFQAHYADLAVMEDDVRASGLDWTIVRPPRLSNRPLTGTYRMAYGRNVRGGWIVPRADVAHLMLRLVDEPDSIAQTVGVAT